MSIHSMKHYLHLDHFHLTSLESTFYIVSLIFLCLILVAPLALFLLTLGVFTLFDLLKY